MRGLGRSARFGLIGVVVVAAIVVVIALTADSSDPNPKLQYGLIFGVIGAFFFILLFLQRGDLNRVASGDERSAGVKRVDEGAIAAHREMWDAARRSIKLGAVIGVLIFLTVPSVYLFDSFVPLLIGGPLIVIAALYGSWRAFGQGG